MRFLVLLIVFGGSGLFSGEKWSYQGTTGPGFWACLDPAYAPCGEGREQSPIALERRVREVTGMPKLRFEYSSSVDLDLINKGYTVQADKLTGTNTLWIGDVPYALIQFHFHTPSEHLMDGQPTKMELHLVHEDKSGKLAVVGYFMQLGRPNKPLAPIFAQMPGPNQTNPIKGLVLSDLEPLAGAEMFRYQGSLTTPDCGEKVAWHVLSRPLTADKEQMEAFIRLFSGPQFPFGNARPVQAINHRQVVRTH